jgi:murein DD-endopeptidase MepM/ murein hydrolase activator NlpD
MNLPLKHAAFAVLTLATLALPARAEAQSRRLLGSPAVISRLERSEPREAGPLLVPVMGVRPEQLRDTYRQSRSEGRTHHAIDIHAPRGTPVLAVADARVRKMHSGDRGGLSVYLVDEDGVTRYYYAHLDAYAEGLREGQQVQRGEVIGFVGDTGNAQPGDCHLHFSVAILDDPAQWWEGRNLNPYDLLVRD